MVRRESVVRRMGDEGNEVADDKWAWVVIEKARDPRSDVGERRDDDAADDHAFLNLTRLKKKKYCAGQ